MRLLATLVFVLLVALVGCKDNDRRRDRPREPRVEQPFVGRVINIPACGAGKAGYVTTKWPAPLSGAAMRIEYTITGSEDARIVGHEQRDAQGRMHLHFQRRGDDFSQSKLDRGYRQWSGAYQLLTLGEHSFEVALTHDQWSNRTGWAEAMLDVENVGFTLGDNQAKGHGVCMKTGTASITITAFTIGG